MIFNFLKYLGTDDLTQKAGSTNCQQNISSFLDNSCSCADRKIRKKGEQLYFSL